MKKFLKLLALGLVTMTSSLLLVACGGISQQTKDSTGEQEVQRPIETPIEKPIEKTSYLVTFDSCGGSTVPDQEITKGNKVKNVNSTRKGYDFVGWYLDADYAEKFNFNTIINEDITLYAKFDIKQYIISFDSNGGSDVSSITLDYNSIINAPLAPTKTGYTFAGWQLKNSNEKYSFGRMPANDIELVAIWKVGVDVYIDGLKVDTILLNADGDAIDYPMPEDITTNPNSEKYFHGWFTDSNFQTPLLPTTVFTKNTKIYGEWITVYSNSFTYSVSNGTANITGFNNTTATVVVIPSYINSFPVTTISASAFKNKTMIRTAIICNGIKNISGYAFQYCNSMEKIDIPQSVEFIDSSAFDGCNLLPKNTKENMTYLGGKHSEYEFALRPIDTTVESITIDNSCRSISSSAFSDCSQLSSIYFYNEYYFIQTGILYKKSPITLVHVPAKISGDIVIPYGVKSISNLFSNNPNITSMVLPDSIDSIWSSAFNNCSSLREITLSNSIKTIGSETFLNCSALTSIVVPKSVTTISEGAFKGCNSLESMTLPFVGKNRETSSSVPRKDAPSPYLFGYIFGSTTASVNTNESKCGRAIGSSSLIWQGQDYYKTEKYSNGWEEGWFYGYYIPTTLRRVTITDATEISVNAFYNCYFLTNIVLENKLTCINSDAFGGCTGLTAVDYLGTLNQWAQIEFKNIYANPIHFTHKLVINGQEVTDVNINDIDSIGSHAFYGCQNLTSVIIGDSVTNIGEGAFLNCGGLTSVALGNNVTSIGKSAFSGCGKLTSIAIPDSVTSIGDYAFYSFGGLTSIILGNGVTSIGQYAFSHCALISITIPDSVASIGDGAFQDCSSLTSVILGDSVTSIGKDAFKQCRHLISITIPDSVTSIGDYAFSYCNGLTSIIIPNNVTSIGYCAFDQWLPSQTVYCRVSSKPSGWNGYWNGYSTTAKVVWGYQG